MMERKDRYDALRREVESVWTFMANDYGVFSPFKVYESDLKRYAIVFSEGGPLQICLVAGPKGLERFISERLAVKQGDYIVRIVDLDTGDDVPFSWKLEVSLA